MASRREIGIPDLKRRLDHSEEAREWNKMREAILGLYHSKPEEPDLIINSPKRCGFSPISLTDAHGVGVTKGYVQFMISRRGDVSGGEEAVGLFPSLGGVTIDTTPPPRTALSTGSWTTWLIYREVEPAHEARIEFKALGTGAPTMERDEEAFALNSFSVIVNGVTGRHVVTLLEQYICDDVQIWLERHMWKPVRTGDDTLYLQGGTVVWPKGLQEPIVGTNLKVADSGSFTITEAGSLWLDLSWTLGMQSRTSAHDTGTTDDHHFLQVSHITGLSSPVYTFRGASVNPPNPPVAGTNNVGVLSNSGDFHYELCSIVLESGKWQVSDQCLDGPIWLPELVDGLLSGPTPVGSPPTAWPS